MPKSFTFLFAVALLLFSLDCAFASGLQTPRYSIESPFSEFINGGFGNTVATDGNVIAVSKSGFYDQINTTYVYDAATGAKRYDLTAFDGPYPLTFGGTIAVGSDRILAGTGCVLCAGFPQTTIVMMFDSQSGAPLGRLVPNDSHALDGFGTSIAIDGQHALVSAPSGYDSGGSSQGAAYLFDLGTQTQLKKFNAFFPTYDADFGSTVALKGNRAIVGGPRFNVTASPAGSGAIWIYDTDTGDQLQFITPPDPSKSLLFGAAVGIYNGLAVVGDPGWDSFQGYGGAVHLIDIATGNLVKTLTPVDENGQPVGGAFGSNLSVWEHFALIGAPYAIDGGATMGRAYLFNLDTFQQLAILTGPADAMIANSFGQALSMAGGIAVVSAPASNVVGEAHVFAVVPEPATIALAAFGFVALLKRTNFRR